ncbi:MAG: adenosylcobinamide-GDP ribazoletransferase [Myxococcales bacterium]
MIRARAAAFAFLTRFPSPLPDINERDLGAAVAFFPLVGLVLGVVTAGLGYLAPGAAPPLVVGVVLVAVLAVITGGLHLDGLSDLFDGLGGGRGDRERTLAIMRDSRIGAHGATALILLLLAKVAAVAALLEAHDFSALLAFPVFARWAVTPQLVLFPYARPEGLGRGFKRGAGWAQLAVASALAMALVASLGWSAARQAVAAFGVALGMGLWLRRRLGGLTGDVYGATIELCEVASLFAAAAAR